jgi:glyoxylase-like metal-dependent hydrolase (beta-lactamase superfamily II)
LQGNRKGMAMTSQNELGLSRRRFMVSAGAAVAAACLVPRRIFATQPSLIVNLIRNEALHAKITVQKLRGNISALLGSGGNIAVLDGADGKLLIDAGISGSRKNLSEAIAGISDNPIKHLVNTHWHFDHTDGNDWLHEAGAEIIAHENTRKHLVKGERVEDWKYTFPPAPAGALPTIVFKEQSELQLNGMAIQLKYYGPAHTDSDISVAFPDADVLHVGDTWWNGIYPLIDYSTGGNIDGSIRAAEANVARAGDKTIIIPGHGPIGDKTQLTEFRDMLVDVRAKVADLKKQGKTVEETIAAKPTAAYDAKWGGFVIDPVFFTTLVYKGV